LRSLPNDMRITQSLDLVGCVSLGSLPEGLDVGVRLDANGCPTLATIGKRLRVGWVLDLTGCAKWDGAIPDDAVIGHRLRTDAHPHGISFHDWRLAHTEWERAKV
jgi:hypothetical protein